MKFRTPLVPIRVDKKIDLSQPLLTIGSCFSESIGNKFQENKFDSLVNPFGTIFDPLSITRLLTNSLNNSTPEADTYILAEGVYKNLELHSSFTGLSQDELELQIRARLSITHEFLRSAKWLLITFGTAHVYKYKKTSAYIANCQKLPAKSFNRELMSVEYLQKDFTEFLQKLKDFNPSLNIILTVSPVRHLKDGIAENTLSKSILRVLCHELVSSNESIHYYPAYELMMDDLRDYRFYEEDMIHPSAQAIDYIWGHFCDSFMSNDSLTFIDTWKKILNDMSHKPFNPSTVAHQNFLRNTLQKLKAIKTTVNVDKEISIIKDQILDV
jgi:lysophospholipase L1-like esterase